MDIKNAASPGAKASLIYLTIGAVMMVWAGIWYVYLNNNPPATQGPYYWCTGFLLTGATLVVIGFFVGRIGRAARHADQAAAVVSQSPDGQPVMMASGPAAAVPGTPPAMPAQMAPPQPMPPQAVQAPATANWPRT